MASFESGKQAYNAQWGVLTLASIGILMGIVMSSTMTYWYHRQENDLHGLN